MKKYLLLFVLFLLPFSVNAEKLKVYQRDEIFCNDRDYCADENKKPVTGMVETRKNGKRENSIEYKKGFMNGKRIQYTPDGKYPLIMFTVIDGNVDGIVKAYWSDTHTVRIEKIWHKGNSVGKGVRYYKNGKKQLTISNDAKEFKFFDRKGQLFAVLNYSEGLGCYKNDKKVKTVTDKQKLLKLKDYFEEQDKIFLGNDEQTLMNYLLSTKEDDFRYLCE